MKHIALANGGQAAVDYHDLDRVVLSGPWSQINGMVAISRTLEDKKPVYLHEFIMGGKCVHIDGDGLNNCRENLRAVPNKKARRKKVEPTE